MDIDEIVAEVAAAVGLAEGESGVRDVLRVVARAEPVPTSQISRLAELPVPIVTAVCNELRKRAVVDKTRPVRLTERAREVLSAGLPRLELACDCCGGARVPGPAPRTAGTRSVSGCAPAPPTSHNSPAEEKYTAPKGRLFFRANSPPMRRGTARPPSASATATQPAAATTPTPKDHKLAFLDGPVDRRTVSPDRVQPPASRYVLQAGSVIPAALITGIRSDLPAGAGLAPSAAPGADTSALPVLL